jgi:hypothetical protein
MKRALIVGINDYPTAQLNGCVTDAKRMHALLSKNGDGSPNFDSRLLTSENGVVVSKALLEEYLVQLLTQDADSAIFYFSGHGSRNILGGFLITQDAMLSSHGLSFHSLHALVMRSPIREITIILDCCHSGFFGNDELANGSVVELREGVTIMAACQPSQLSKEKAWGGVFTSLMVSALEGEAADIMGNVTLASIYNHADGLLTAWDQRPLFKAHVSQMQPVRTVPSNFPFRELCRIRKLFSTLDFEIRLSPAYEPSADPRDEQKEEEFSLLQKFRAAGLVEPVFPHIHLYTSAMEGGRCRLTPSGRFYWKMCGRGRE